MLVASAVIPSVNVMVPVVTAIPPLITEAVKVTEVLAQAEPNEEVTVVAVA